MKFAKNIERHVSVPHGGLYSVKSPNQTLVDFSSNVNPLGFPPSVKRLLKTGLQNIPVYPDHNSTKLRKHLSKHAKIPIGNLVIGNGATEIIYNFCQAVIDKNTPVLIPVPTFGEYEAAVNLCGGKIEFFKTMDLSDDVSDFIKKIPKNGCVFVCNPNNPTGTLIPKNTMLKILRAAKSRSTILFVDECFMELTQSPKESLIDHIITGNLFILQSLTKSFGLAGLRVGYGIGDKKMISILHNIKIPWNVGGLSQDAAVLALSDKRFLPKTRKVIKKEHVFLTNSISRLDGFFCFDSATNFILIKTKTKSKALQKNLLKKNILIRDCSTFRGLDDSYIRIAIKTHKENTKLLAALEELR
ncbi:MAG: histidinol-phosphate aminotransferase family protein [Candidatus Nitrosotenuis sp.]|nr:MAG: histidinol-phosphate aminotransferase family protein [Candidatus Nitrosotenuis sp.]